MKNYGKMIKTVALFVALPLIATAAASAHTWLTDSNPISIELGGVVAKDVQQLGSARIHSVSLNRSGAIVGRIAAIDQETKKTSGLAELKVFFVQNGEVAGQSITDADGTFSVEGIAEGVYSFVATGSNGFAAYGVRVVANDGNDQLNIMEAAAVSPKFAVVKKILDEKLPQDVVNQIAVSAEPNGSERLIGSNRVRLIDGSLTGHVVPILGDVAAVEGTYVHILKNNEQVAEVQADKEGNFTVNDLEEGVYDFVAAGPTGFAAVSFHAVQDSGAESVIVQSDSDEVAVSAETSPVSSALVPADPISYQDSVATDLPMDSGYGYSDNLDVCLTCGQTGMDYGYTGDYYPTTAPIDYAGQAIGCGAAAGGACGACGDFSGYSSCGGGCGGGGAGGFGGGRLLGLAAIAGLTVGIIALTDNNPTDPGGASPNS